MLDRSRLWIGVEAVEKRKDAQLAREVEISLPRELGAEDRRALVEGYVREHFVSQGMIADVSLHRGHSADGQEQPHAHVMLTMRDLRSEEHTSELQSLMRISYAVFCLNKKKTIQHHHTNE